MLLDEHGTYHMSVGDFFEDPTIFQGHDMVTETTMTVTAIRVRGMDSFRNFEPLVAIGAQTFRSNMAIDEVDIEIDITLVMKASTHESSIIVDSSNPPVIEHITLTTGIRDVVFSAGILMAIDGDALGDLQIGSLLHMDQIVGCAMSTVIALDVCQLSVSIGDIVAPQMNGFISVGLDRVANELVNTVFLMYEAVALKAMPHFFETEIRENVVNAWLSAYDEENSVCPAPVLTLHDGVIEEETGRMLVDFNKMFYDVSVHVDEDEETISRPYGDLFAKIKDMIDNTFTALDESTGIPRINADMIAPFTESQSGT